MSKREQILQAFYNALKALETSNLKVYRNLDKPQKIERDGIIIIRDGDVGEPEVLLSPLTYIYEHYILLEVMVQNADANIRDATLDNLLVSISNIINSNPTLGGLSEWLEAKAPETAIEPIEGSSTIRTANVQVMARYYTNNSLN